MSAVTFPERLPSNVILMGVMGLAHRPRKHLAAWSLTIVTLAVLTATLVLAVLNTRRTGVSRLGLDSALAARSG